MKKTIALGIIILIPFLCGTAFAAIDFYSMTYYGPSQWPSQSDTDLEHSYAYYWGINASEVEAKLTEGYEITSASLVIEGLNNSTEPDYYDRLWLNLFDNDSQKGNDRDYDRGYSYDYWDYNSGEADSDRMDLTYEDENGNVYDYFFDDNDPPGSTDNYSYVFDTEDEINTLTNFIANNKYYGISLDADCHYGYSGLYFAFNMQREDSTPPGAPVPEPGTMVLLSAGLILFGATRKKFKRS